MDINVGHLLGSLIVAALCGAAGAYITWIKMQVMLDEAKNDISGMGKSLDRVRSDLHALELLQAESRGEIRTFGSHLSSLDVAISEIRADIKSILQKLP
jgi:hypothetical protein